jgi:death-on-curing protein
VAIHYFTAEYAIHIHDKIIALSGGFDGVKTLGNIESPLAHIQNDDYYPDFVDKLTHLLFTLNKFHAFHDGNKRTAIAMGAFFLEINGLGAVVDKFIIEMENIAVTVADNIIDKQLLYRIIHSILTEPDYSEGIKLQIIQALEQVNPHYNGLNIGTAFYKDLF